MQIEVKHFDINKHKNKIIDKVLEQIYDIWQAPSIDEVKEQAQEQVQKQK